MNKVYDPIGCNWYNNIILIGVVIMLLLLLN